MRAVTWKHEEAQQQQIIFQEMHVRLFVLTENQKSPCVEWWRHWGMSIERSDHRFPSQSQPLPHICLFIFELQTRQLHLIMDNFIYLFMKLVQSNDFLKGNKTSGRVSRTSLRAWGLSFQLTRFCICPSSDWIDQVFVSEGNIDRSLTFCFCLWMWQHIQMTATTMSFTCKCFSQSYFSCKYVLRSCLQ